MTSSGRGLRPRIPRASRGPFGDLLLILAVLEHRAERPLRGRPIEALDPEQQTGWGIKPYTGLFGALKVADEVEVLIETAPPTGGEPRP